jgi:D-3-phosphoglycerate dehydrogenase
LIGLHRHARLVRLGEVPLELSLSGRIILVIENGDVPGVVGHVGTVLSSAHINIANMSLGRTGKTALTLLELDSLPDEKTLAALRQSKGVLSAKIVSL